MVKIVNLGKLSGKYGVVPLYASQEELDKVNKEYGTNFKQVLTFEEWRDDIQKKQAVNKKNKKRDFLAQLDYAITVREYFYTQMKNSSHEDREREIEILKEAYKIIEAGLID